MLFGKRDPLHPYERGILEAIAMAAPDDLSTLVRAQIDQIGHVQRSAASPEINFYRDRKGRPFDEGSLLPNRDEIRVADLTVRIGGQQHKGHLYAVGGQIFSLVLRPDVARPKQAVAENIDIGPINADLLSPLPAASSAALEIAPASFLNRDSHIQDQSNGRWTALQTAEIYAVALEQADWVVLGQGPQAQLLLGRRTEEREAFCVANLESDDIRPLGASSWVTALREAEEGAA